MFVAYLAVSAGRVVTFRRADLSIYSKDSDPIGDLIATEDGRTERKV